MASSKSGIFLVLASRLSPRPSAHEGHGKGSLKSLSTSEPVNHEWSKDSSSSSRTAVERVATEGLTLYFKIHRNEGWTRSRWKRCVSPGLSWWLFQR